MINLCKHNRDKDHCDECLEDLRRVCCIAFRMNQQLPGFGTIFLTEYHKNNKPMMADELIKKGGFNG